MSRCVVLMADEKFMEKAINTIANLRTIGKYSDTVVLLTHPDIDPVEYSVQIDAWTIQLKSFELIDTSYIVEKIKECPFKKTDKRELNKLFQWHKIHIFDEFFKQWDSIFYIDAGMYIYNQIEPFWEMINSNPTCLLAHSDAFPSFQWKLGSHQFDKESYPELYADLENEIDLNVDYFQSGILLFNSQLIESNTKSKLIDLANKYHISRTNEQGIMNIYFNGILKCWKSIETNYMDDTNKNKANFTYDFSNRNGNKPNQYIMIKYIQR